MTELPPSASPVESHYHRHDARGAIAAALADLTVDEGGLPQVLAGVDEFHLGGRVATERLVQSLQIRPGCRVLDVGSGIGGPARAVASLVPDVGVTGIDLTPEFVAIARTLTDQVGMADRVHFELGDAQRLTIGDEAVDFVTLIHVGMNIADKGALFAEFARVLKPGGRVGVYDIMRTGTGPLTYPVPWASHEAMSFVATPDEYVEWLNQAGLRVVEVAGQRELVSQVLAALKANPPNVHLGHLMGPEWPQMFGNLLQAFRAGVVEPTIIVAEP